MFAAFAQNAFVDALMTAMRAGLIDMPAPRDTPYTARIFTSGERAGCCRSKRIDRRSGGKEGGSSRYAFLYYAVRLIRADVGKENLHPKEFTLGIGNARRNIFRGNEFRAPSPSDENRRRVRRGGSMLFRTRPASLEILLRSGNDITAFSANYAAPL